MFFILLTNDETYPGADYNSFELPPFRLDNLANSDLITKDTLEGNFILNVWASWCITCRIEHPYLMNLNNNGIPIIGLNYKDERDDAINWLNKYGNPYDLTVHDYKGTLALDLGVTGAPETFLVHNGKVVAHYQGEVNKFIWEDVFLPVIKEREIF
jgi:cytochrome c biogenesis protein CcmG/thiol:disulfide interchange protein DsbE